MGGAPTDESVEHDRVLPNVNFEGRRGPATDGLNYRKINPSFRKGSSTARPDGVAGIIRAGEETVEA